MEVGKATGRRSGKFGGARTSLFLVMGLGAGVWWGRGRGDAGPPRSEQVSSLLGVAGSLLGGSGDQRTKNAFPRV